MVASPQTSFGARSSRDKRTAKDVCGEAIPVVHANKSHADGSYLAGILGLGKALVLVIQHGRRDVSCSWVT